MVLLSQAAAGILLRVRVQPRASRNQLVGIHGDALKLAVTAPPVDGLANRAVSAFFADLFAVPRRDVSILRGQEGRSKQVAIAGLSLETAVRVLREKGITL